MAPFAGWDMPLHYGSQVEEHHRVRRDAGMFDVSHMLAIEVLGPGARDFLRSMLANDVAKLAARGKALYSCMLDAHGGVLDDLIVYFLDSTHYRIVVNAGTAGKDLAWLREHAARATQPVELAPRHDLALIAVQGPNAREKTWRALPQIRADTEALAVFQGAETDNMLIARTGYTGEDGFELMLDAARAEQVWHSLQAQAVPPAGLGARDTLRLEAGMNLYGQDMDETVTPFEAALAWTVDCNPGRDFIGRSALVARPARWQLLGLVLLERGVMRAHQRVRTVTGDGVVTSGSFSPTLGRSIALARLPTDLSAGDGVEISVRDKWIRARVVKPPFVRYGTIRVTG